VKILVTGASGFVGTALVKHLTAKGHEPLPLGRSRSAANGVVWNPETGDIEADKLAGIGAVIHLAGENIASGRWTAARKQRLTNSRLKGTQLIAETISKMSPPPSVLVSVSAIGYYGDRANEILREESPPGRGFLADLCVQWEAATEAATRKGIRVVHPRLGIVLARHGGVLGKMLLPFKLGVGGKVGSGNQYMSWITLDDLCAVLLHCAQASNLHGPVNAVAPNPVTNLQFTQALGNALSRPTIFPLPAFVARTALGEMADELLLCSARVEPRKLINSRFGFRHPELGAALRSIL
jgi:uncharacterized protein (TIGR01777 family)